jgi:hypothetical protein
MCQKTGESKFHTSTNLDAMAQLVIFEAPALIPGCGAQNRKKPDGMGICGTMEL